MAQQRDQAIHDALAKALTALGLDADYIMGAAGTGGTGFSITFSSGSGGSGGFGSISNWAKGFIGTVWGGNGLAVGASRNSDGSINVGVGFGVGFNISSSAMKDQTIQADFGFGRGADGKWRLGGSLLIWIGATTEAENKALWDGAFGQ